MSYILEALRRAERERKQGQVSVLDEVVVVKSAEPARRRPLQGWLPAVAVTVVIALMLYAVLARRNHAGKDAVPATPVAAAPGTPAAPPGLRPMPPPAPPVVAARRAAAPPPAATIEDGGKIASLDDVARPPPPQPDQQPDQPSAQELPPPTPQPMRSPHFGLPPRAGVPPPQTAAASPPATANDAAANDAAADEIETTTADNGDTPPPAPAAAAAPAAAQHALREMPESFRANFPAFTVDVHAYNDNPQRRFVIVNGKRYHDGDTLAEGPRLIAIVPEGMVLDWQGQQVLYAIAR
jgi:general secretion pathway protein B